MSKFEHAIVIPHSSHGDCDLCDSIDVEGIQRLCCGKPFHCWDCVLKQCGWRDVDADYPEKYHGKKMPCTNCIHYGFCHSPGSCFDDRGPNGACTNECRKMSLGSDATIDENIYVTDPEIIFNVGNFVIDHGVEYPIPVIGNKCSVCAAVGELKGLKYYCDCENRFICADCVVNRIGTDEDGKVCADCLKCGYHSIGTMGPDDSETRYGRCVKCHNDSVAGVTDVEQAKEQIYQILFDDLAEINHERKTVYGYDSEMTFEWMCAQMYRPHVIAYGWA